MLGVFTALLCFTTCMATVFTQTLSGAAMKKIVDSSILPLMNEDAIPGMAVAVVIDGRSYIFNYGYAAVDRRKRVNNETLFEIGSISKTFTATLTSWARVQSRLSLNDTVDRYLPNLAGTPFGRRTLLSLGTHTPGGLPLQFPSGVVTTVDLDRYLKQWRPKYAMGTYRTYGNPGIGVLGLIAAKSFAEDYRALVEQKLLPALRLRNTFIAVPKREMSNYAWGYMDGKPIRMVADTLSDETGGIRTTASDMARYVQDNIEASDLSPSIAHAIEETHRGYYQAGPMTQDLIWEQFPYPVTLFALLEGNSDAMLFKPYPVRPIRPPSAPKKTVWLNKTGSTNGFAAYVAFVPSKRVGIVLLANNDYPIRDRVKTAYRILKALR